MIDDSPYGPLLDHQDVADLIGGVTSVEVKACYDAQKMHDGPQCPKLPSDWVRRSRQRSAQYKVLTGREDMRGAILFYRRQRELAELAERDPN